MADTSLHIVFAEQYAPSAVERMRGVGRITQLERCDEATLKEAVRDCDALLIRTYAKVTAGALAGARRLKVIGRGGVGLENIDLEAARAAGVAVVYTPAAGTEAVADLTVGLMIGLIRGIRGADEAVRGGRFLEARSAAPRQELGELTLGVIGMGRIGRAVARRCRHGFGMTVLYNDLVAPGWLDFAATPVSKDELYASADIVSLHVPLTDLTRGMISGEVLDRFRPGAMLINTARGAVVDGCALAERLRGGRISGAGLDVFDPEPITADHPLMSAPNTIFTPHVGARTVRALAAMNEVAEDVVRVLQGREPTHRA
ncbi:MAG: hypothetical protein HY763_05790 [Planctomycetes bacterium]|nr:hypothetical protein [Planctomycetota bacterium]